MVFSQGLRDEIKKRFKWRTQDNIETELSHTKKEGTVNGHRYQKLKLVMLKNCIN